MDPSHFTPRQFFWFWLASVGLTFGTAALLRKLQGLPFFRPAFPDAEIQQGWRSGTSSVGLMGRLSRANNCLWFALTSDTLHIGLHFPFNMFMPRFLTGFDLEIPVASISSVSEKTAMLQGDYVRVEYEVTDETRGTVRTERVDLWPKRGDRFVEILREKARVARTRAGRGVSPSSSGT